MDWDYLACLYTLQVEHLYSSRDRYSDYQSRLPGDDYPASNSWSKAESDFYSALYMDMIVPSVIKISDEPDPKMGYEPPIGIYSEPMSAHERFLFIDNSRV